MAPSGELRVKAGVVCWQVKLCDPHLSALEARFSRRGAIQFHHLYLYLYTMRFISDLKAYKSARDGCIENVLNERASVSGELSRLHIRLHTS